MVQNLYELILNLKINILYIYQVTNVRVGQDLLEHQHRLEEEEATRKRTERLDQDKKSSSEKFEEVIRTKKKQTNKYFYLIIDYW